LQTGEKVFLFNPRQQKWADHFVWSEDSTQIIGKTACGRATVNALKLNNALAMIVRQNWIQAGWHPPNILMTFAERLLKHYVP
jgi:hypothetical protein